MNLKHVWKYKIKMRRHTAFSLAPGSTQLLKDFWGHPFWIARFQSLCTSSFARHDRKPTCGLNAWDHVDLESSLQPTVAWVVWRYWTRVARTHVQTSSIRRDSIIAFPQSKGIAREDVTAKAFKTGRITHLFQGFRKVTLH